MKHAKRNIPVRINDEFLINFPGKILLAEIKIAGAAFFFRSRGSLSGSDEILCDIHESDHRSITIGTSHVYRDGGKLTVARFRQKISI